MNENKFRAWDKAMKQWVFVSSLNSYSPAMTFEFCYDKNLCVIMQYTGLRDKNGKEIYEGDVIAHPDFAERSRLVVSIKDGCAKAGGWDCVRTDFRQAKVVGNIYENPDLLKTL